MAKEKKDIDLGKILGLVKYLPLAKQFLSTIGYKQGLRTGMIIGFLLGVLITLIGVLITVLLRM